MGETVLLVFTLNQEIQIVMEEDGAIGIQAIIIRPNARVVKVIRDNKKGNPTDFYICRIILVNIGW